MTGSYRSRDRALEAVSRDFGGAPNTPDVPEWGEDELCDVLEQMNDLTGIEEPNQ